MKRFFLGVALGVIVIIGAPAVGFCQRTGLSRHLSAEAILKKAAESYAVLFSYQDSGIVTTTYDEPTGGRVDKLPFKLFFSRPDSVRCEWLDYYLDASGRLSVVWSNPKGTFLYRQPDRYETRSTLELGIATATGISSSACYDVPRLLIPEINGWAVTNLKETKLVGEEIFEGESCYQITGYDFHGVRNDVWIGKRDFLIRKLRSSSASGELSITQEQVHRDIKINQSLTPAVFNFQPSIALRDPTSNQGGILYEPARASWTEFVAPDRRFSLLMPGQPASQTVTFETRAGRMTHRSYFATAGGITCIIDFADMQKGSYSPEEARVLFDDARRQFIKDTRGKLIGERPISLDGYQGREIKIQMPGAEAVARFYLADYRFYQLAITTLDSIKNSESEVNRFFSSLKIESPNGIH